ncbi:unnamed protein product [Schistocephalus solidus]|uniref:PSP domain-containing protein n=1 Tax=Schistocephalus solidus TaxID=70667 RepID=A0A183T9J1_SCHSO|nr:unnamed protein product [Schistocephalus solidus]
MAILENPEPADGDGLSESGQRFLTRQQERNRKKRSKKKAAKQRKKQTNPDETLSNLQFPSKTPSQKSSDEEDDELPVFELKGAFERFKRPSTNFIFSPSLQLVFEDETDKVEGTEGAGDGSTNGTTSTTSKSISHPDINLKARTAALLAEEAAAKASAQAAAAAAAAESKKEEGEAPAQLSKKKLKLLNRPSVASLKQAVSRPDVVEMWDVCARDPLLLVYLKSYRNTVPVPKHWCAKRKYLQGKRGFEKPPFRLPEFIARTGIMEMRQAITEKESDKSLKTKMREKIRPKMGKVDIDYQKLHDAFFKYQTRPKLTQHGDLYYEGKEFEVKLKEKKPGALSEELRTALGLPVGPNADRYPPPWLIAMQRYGPPPSYPNIIIPGLNAPIPSGCAFGYHPGGWGKPPVDELGRPIYGDVFGNGGNIAGVPPPPPATVGKQGFWGELESDEESEEEEEEEEEEDEEDQEGAPAAAEIPPGEVIQPIEKSVIDLGGLVTPASGLITPSGVSSVGAGLETPNVSIELRKKTIEEAMEKQSGFATPSGTGLAAGQLYRVLPERETNIQAPAMLGSTKLYDVTGVTGAPRGEEAEDPRERMLRKRPAGSESQQSAKAGTASASGTASGATSSSAAPTAPKKYKEFKF